MAIGVAANWSRAAIEDAMLQSDPVELSTAVTATVEIAAAKVGYRSACAALYVKSSGASNSIQLKYGASSTDLTGAIPLDDGESFRIDGNDFMILAGPNANEDLDIVLTRSAGNLEGYAIPVYVKEV